MIILTRTASLALCLSLLLPPQAEAARAVGAAAAAKPAASFVLPLAVSSGLGAAPQSLASPSPVLSLPALTRTEPAAFQSAGVVLPGASASAISRAAPLPIAPYASESIQAPDFPQPSLRSGDNGRGTASSLFPGASTERRGRQKASRAPSPEEVSHRGLVPLAKALEGVSAEAAAAMSGTQGHAFGLSLERALTGGESKAHQAGEVVPVGGDWKHPPSIRLQVTEHGDAAEKINSVSDEEKEAALEKLGPVSAPPIALYRLGLAAFWGGLLSASAAPLYMAGKPAIMVVAVVMALAAGMMVQFFAGAAQGISEANGAAAQAITFSPEQRAQAVAEINALAAREKLPAPQSIEFLAREGVNAQVAGVLRSNWRLNLTRGFLDLPTEEREAILLHELAHVRHWDTLTITALLWVASAAPVFALLGGVTHDSVIPFFASVVASVFGFFYWSRVQEYAADRYAVYRQGGARSLVSFFFKLSDDERRAVQAASGRLFSEESKWKNRFRRAWALALQSLHLHPLTEFRISALARRARAPKRESAK